MISPTPDYQAAATEKVVLKGENFDVILVDDKPAIRINVGGHVIVMTAEKWHEVAKQHFSEKDDTARDLLERSLPLLRGHVHGGAMVKRIETYLVGETVPTKEDCDRYEATVDRPKAAPQALAKATSERSPHSPASPAAAAFSSEKQETSIAEGHDWQPDGGTLKFESHPGGEALHVHTTCSKCGARAWFLEYQWELLSKGCASSQELWPQAGTFHCACIFNRAEDFGVATLVKACAYHARREEAFSARGENTAADFAAQLAAVRSYEALHWAATWIETSGQHDEAVRSFAKNMAMTIRAEANSRHPYVGEKS